LLMASASATPVEIGSTVDEPETLIEPVTAPPAALPAGEPPGALSAVGAGAVVAPPPLLHAATISVAANARAPMRRVVAWVTDDSSSCPAASRRRVHVLLLPMPPSTRAVNEPCVAC
jgi:hypothetical protein